MFREMRRIERQLERDEIEKILNAEKYGVLSTTGTDGYPYGVPVSYVYTNGRIFFHGANTGSKVDNIYRNNKVCFTVVGNVETLPDKFSTKYESVILFGEAERCTDECKRRILGCLIDKYSRGYEEKGQRYISSMMEKTAVYEIVIQHMTGKARK